MSTFCKWKAAFCVTLVVVSFQGRASAQTNSWTNSASAAWESTNWSLGVLPGSTQSIMITNAGYKAIGISPSTRANYSNSMIVTNLTILAPTNAFNTLLLNFFGTNRPLEVLNGCTIGTNGLIANLYSAFEVSGYWLINGGQYVQEGGLTIATNGGVYLNQGSLNLTNAIFQGSIQSGGTVTQVQGQTSGGITIYYLGNYNFLSGTITGKCLFNGGGVFSQFGGTNWGAIQIGGGTDFSDASGQYTLSNGLVSVSDIAVGSGEYGHGYFSQYAGTVLTTSLELGSYGDGVGTASGYYLLTNGTLTAGSMHFANGGFGQSGGMLVTTNSIFLRGVPDFDYGPALYVNFGISGGTMTCPGLSVSMNGSFYQSGGTNTVNGDIAIGGSSYALSAGVVLASNVEIFSNEWGLPGYSVYRGAFQQTGGEARISNTLTVSDDCSVTGGSLNASNIFLTGALSLSSPGTILNPGLFQFAGTLQVSGGAVANLGKLLLVTNAVIDFTTGANKISFLNSAAINWTPAGALVVTNWNGSTNGGGADQLRFGNNSSTLTPAQLQQIIFVNPAGFPNGNYAATILATGEIVPSPHPFLSWQSAQGILIMSWTGKAILQSSTNVLGPFVDVSNAPSPYTNSSPGTSRFFRLRR